MTTTETPTQAVDALRLTITSEFVPFSMSRNAKPSKHDGKPWRSLNWEVTLHCNGKPILTTDYSVGEGRCPAYKANIKSPGLKRQCIDLEIESGCESVIPREGLSPWSSKKLPLLPNAIDVIHSLVSDSDVIDYATYEEWAETFGYDPDSRDGEKIYRQCLRHALKLRSAIGSDALERLRTAFQDY